MSAADGGASVLIGRSRHRAGVEDDQISVARRTGMEQTVARQLTFQSGTIGLGGAASEAVQKKSRHESIIEVQLYRFCRCGLAHNLLGFCTHH